MQSHDSASRYILSIDQGTTSSRAIIYDDQAQPVASAQQEFPQYFPADGWVEHDPESIWESVLAVCREALRRADLAATAIAAIGITNQRETTLVWERDSGKAIYPAIVWQDRRTADRCQTFRQQLDEADVQQRTGLLIDPYFSATKIRWILDHVDGAQARAEAGELLFGTVDSFLLWRLTNGAVHRTEATNASRTLLFNLREQCWDSALCAAFNIPMAMLPEVMDCCAEFGCADPQWLGAAIPVSGIAGDQQAALVGQVGFTPGMIKSTYGTGCFMILNTGKEPVISRNRLLSTVAYRLNGEVTYGLEGSIFVAGAAVQWLRDGVELIRSASETEALARAAKVDHGVYMVPAFTGLGAPYWDPAARGALLGLTRDTGIQDIVSAGLQAVAYQTRDLVEAMVADGADTPTDLRVDGGMMANNWVAQFLSDILNINVERPALIETTALGAAYLAGLQCGLFESLESITALWQRDQRFEPQMEPELRARLYDGWLAAVARVRSGK